MTCIHTASSAPAAVLAWWLHSDSPSGPRSPRTRSRSMALSGPVTSTETNWTDDGLMDTETRQRHQEQLLAWHRGQLMEELAQRRRKHRSTLAVMSDLQEATHAILAMGEA